MSLEEYPTWCWGSPYGGHLVFARVCPQCSRFVSPDKGALSVTESFDGIYTFKENATCKKHGRVQMPFIGDM